MKIPEAEIILRRAELSDAEELFHVHREAVEAMSRRSYSNEQISIWFTGRSPEIYFNEISAGRIWLASVAHVTAGFVEYEPGEIAKLFVLSSHSGRGIGKRLLHLGIAKAQQAGQPVVVIATLNSQHFYERHGFVKVEDTHFVRGESDLRYDVTKMVLAR